MPVLRSKIGVFVAGLILALCLPGIAFAANTAVFTGASPAPGSSSTVTKPTVSVTVFDTYGVSSTSSNFSLYVDGIKRAVKMTRLSGWGTRKFKLSFALTSPLSVGNHPVVVYIHDVRNKWSKYTWSFNVFDGTAPVTTSNAVLNYVGTAMITLHATDNAPGVVNTYYMLDGGAPVLYSGPIVVPALVSQAQHSLEFWSVDAAGNVEAHHLFFFLQQRFATAAESFAAAHALPTLAADAVCMSPACHGTDPRTHGATDLATIHNFPYPGGTLAAPGCAACHAGTAVASNDCSLVACHGQFGPHASTHIAISTDTTNPAPCTASTCHGTDAMDIHKGGCVECHSSTKPLTVAAIAAGMAPSPVLAKCETCHAEGFAALHAPGDPFHEVTASILPDPSCITPVCHNFTDVTAIHGQDLTGLGAPAAPGCQACHKPGQAPPSTIRCLTCHPTGINTPTHPRIPAAHITTNTCASGNVDGCHPSDVMAIHTTQIVGGPTPPGCIACHAVNVTPTTDCANVNCHPNGLAEHNAATIALANTSHNANGIVGAGCFLSGCHLASKDIAQIHASWINPPGCAACHTTLRSAAVNCTSCHPDVHGDIQTVAHSSLMAAGCTGLGCHAVQNGVVSPSGTALLDVEHNNWGITCLDCHASTDLRVGNAVTNHLNACDACHSGTGSNPNLNSNYHGAEFTNPLNASGHNVVGNANSLTTFRQFTDNTGASINQTWPLPTANVFWSQAPTATQEAAAAKGLNTTVGWGSVVTCNDCHDVAAGIHATGPHGSTQSWAVDPNFTGSYNRAVLYSELDQVAQETTTPVVSNDFNTGGMSIRTGTGGTTGAAAEGSSWLQDEAAGIVTTSAMDPASGHAVICAKCHDLFNASPSATSQWALSHGEFTFTVTDANKTGVSDWSNTPHSSHHMNRAIDGTGACINCHAAIPHGWTRPRLIVFQSDPAPYNAAATTVGNGMLGVDSANTIVVGGVTIPSGSAFTAHNGGFYGLPVSQALLGATLNSTGGEVWSSAQCNACGDHTANTTSSPHWK
jgi:hypothetical protein